MGYMSELLALPAPPEKPTHTPIYTPNSATMHAKLVKADYHGALVTGPGHTLAADFSPG